MRSLPGMGRTAWIGAGTSSTLRRSPGLAQSQAHRLRPSARTSSCPSPGITTARASKGSSIGSLQARAL